MNISYELAKLQSLQLETVLIIAASEVKEYKEDWRNTPILRQGGRFASKAKSAIDKKLELSEQVVNNAIFSVNQRIDIIKDLFTRLNASAKEKLRKIFQSLPMNKAKEEIGQVLEDVSPEAKQVFDEINESIDSELKAGKPLEAALSKGQNQAMDSLRKALDSMKDAAKEHKAGLLAMGACAALTATAGAAGLLIGVGAVGAVGNWSVPNLLGNAVEFATTKQLLKDDKDLFAVWGAEFDAEISQFLFRASLVVAGIGVLVLAEEVFFHALEEDKKTFAQGVKVLAQGAASEIVQEDVGRLGEYYNESKAKRLDVAKQLSQQVEERATEFATEVGEQARDAATKAASQAIEDAQKSTQEALKKKGDELKETALDLIPGRAEKQRIAKEKQQKQQEAAENEQYKEIARQLVDKYSGGKGLSPEEIQRTHLEYERLAEERRLKHEQAREHLRKFAEEKEARKNKTK